MYVMFAGFMHGAAMVTPAGVTAGTTPPKGNRASSSPTSVTSWPSVPTRASAPRSVTMVQRLIQRQIDAGHGEEGFARIIESIKQPG
ncbi:hypothetical protein [Streptomyces sp. DG2A-72]|uniref:hypothetical protein n=1 Tax=Streptomyces sp. DG2A-72 TaxID=3051386 RepID=UPI003463F0C4